MSLITGMKYELEHKIIRYATIHDIMYKNKATDVKVSPIELMVSIK